MLVMAAEILIFVSLAVLAYTYVGYPALFIFSASMTALAAVVFRLYFGGRPLEIVPVD